VHSQAAGKRQHSKASAIMRHSEHRHRIVISYVYVIIGRMPPLTALHQRACQLIGMCFLQGGHRPPPLSSFPHSFTPRSLIRTLEPDRECHASYVSSMRRCDRQSQKESSVDA